MELDVKLTQEYNLSLEYLVQSVGEFEQECEFVDHASDPEAHHGETLWYLQIQCSHCPGRSPLLACCNGFRDWVHTNEHLVQCAACLRTTPAWDSVYICKRIGGNW